MERLANKKSVWTAHAKNKVRFYRFSPSRVERVLRAPARIEEGVAEKTIAAMQPGGTPKNPYEIWVMFTEGKTTRKIISAWKYPGRTKPGASLPPHIFEQLARNLEE